MVANIISMANEYIHAHLCRQCTLATKIEVSAGTRGRISLYGHHGAPTGGIGTLVTPSLRSYYP